MYSKMWTALTVIASATVLLSGCGTKIGTSHATNFVTGIIPDPKFSIRVNNHLDDGDANRSEFGSGKTFQEKQAELERHMYSRKKIKAVVVVKQVGDGDRYTIGTLEERYVEERELRENAITSVYSALGRKAKYTLQVGTPLDQDDIE